MTSKELDQYANKLCGNYWVSLDKHPELIDTVLQHESFAYITKRNAYSISVYFYCDDSPTRVSNFASIDSSKAELLNSKIGGIQAGLNWANNIA